jgi:hypothetical protein
MPTNQDYRQADLTVSRPGSHLGKLFCEIITFAIPQEYPLMQWFPHLVAHDRVTIISRTGAAICTAVVIARCNSRL